MKKRKVLLRFTNKYETSCISSILTYNFVLSLRQVVADHSAYVGAQTMSDAVYVVSGSAHIREVLVKLSSALAH